MRRERSATESLLSIVLGLEAVLMFFVTLAVFRFDVLRPTVAFGGGAAVIVVMLVVSRLLRYRSGVWLGWVVQLGLVALGFLLPLMFFIGAGFAAIWTYCFITGVRLDRRNAALRATADSEPSTLPSTSHAEEQ
ncbi:DUF4233 domain-containing protein [Parafrigoribacterium soli]|uniref:DUF4233 domain-containing protein n=1 Tax=Parafrigoribacterium soli TaxID=3144663 RepID=UPI0032ECF17D